MGCYLLLVVVAGHSGIFPRTEELLQLGESLLDMRHRFDHLNFYEVPRQVIKFFM